MPRSVHRADVVAVPSRVRARHRRRGVRHRPRAASSSCPTASTRPVDVDRRGDAAAPLPPRPATAPRLPGDHPPPQGPPAAVRPARRTWGDPDLLAGPARVDRARPSRRSRRRSSASGSVRAWSAPVESPTPTGTGSSPPPRRSCSRPSTRDSARRCSRRWRSARRWSAATGRRCPRSPATPPLVRPLTVEAWATALDEVAARRDELVAGRPATGGVVHDQGLRRPPGRGLPPGRRRLR